MMLASRQSLVRCAQPVTRSHRRCCAPTHPAISPSVPSSSISGQQTAVWAPLRMSTGAHKQRSSVLARGEFVGGSSLATTDDGTPMRVATIGDTVTLHFTCKDSDGNVLQSSRDEDCPLTFEVGAGDVIGNKLFQGFDEAVRGLAEGETAEIEASGGEWRPELLFAVPKDHPEMQRLEGKYKSQGGLKDGMIVELANMSLANILEVTDTTVKLDANNMMAGKRLFFTLEVAGLNRLPEEPKAGERIL